MSYLLEEQAGRHQGGQCCPKPDVTLRVTLNLKARAKSGSRADENLYRPGFSGHKILQCGRPYWGECSEPFAPGLSRAALGIRLQQPVLVIARDEGPNRG